MSWLIDLGVFGVRLLVVGLIDLQWLWVSMLRKLLEVSAGRLHQCQPHSSYVEEILLAFEFEKLNQTCVLRVNYTLVITNLFCAHDGLYLRMEALS